MKSKYDYYPADLEVLHMQSVTPTDLGILVKEIYEEHIREVHKIPITETSVKLKSFITQRTEGQSTANVYELSFCRDDDRSSLCKYIIRHHNGADSEEAARNETQLVRQINFFNSDYFSSNLIDSTFSMPGVVVYRHADDQVGEKAHLLQDVILNALRNVDPTQIEKITNGLEKLATNLINVYEHLNNEKRTVKATTWFSSFSSRLYPEIVINAVSREITISDGQIVIHNEDGSLISDNKAKQIKLSSLLDQLYYNPNIQLGWVDLRVWPTSLTACNKGILRFKSKGVSDEKIWVRTDNTFINLEDREYRIIVKCDSGLISTDVTELKNLGFSTESILQVSQIRDRVEGSEISLRLRHTDLHCRNVLSTIDGQMKTIDLSSTAYDFAAVPLARIEISIWTEVLKKYPDIASSDVEKILAALSIGLELPADSVDDRLWAIYRFIKAFRDGINKADIPEEQSNHNLLLAYVAQIFLAQRYHMEKQQLASSAFNTVASFWIKQFVNFGPNIPYANSCSMSEILSVKEDSSAPTIISLWKKALTLPHYDTVLDGKPYDALQSFIYNNCVLMHKQLTSLQRVIWEDVNGDNPFHSKKNVIIAGPTSSGKSTVAEIFLSIPPLMNKIRRCSLYIAPTRALTQAKYAELKNTYQYYPEMSEGIVLSTGEDTDYDWHITHGRFTIACMVYEKANMLFSVGRNLLDRLGCVVVDEIHMLTNLERGPILELALTKIRLESIKVSSQASSAPHQEFPKIIAISTEDKPDVIFENFLSLPDEDGIDEIRPALFQDSQRPIQVQHSLILSDDPNSPYMIFPVVKFASSENRTLSKAQLSELNSELTRSFKRIQDFSGKRMSKNPKFELKNELKRRCLNLIIDIIKKHPKGHRVMVFVPGRREAEDWATTLKNDFKELAGVKSVSRLAPGVRHDEILRELSQCLQSSEDDRLSSIIRECAALGIFIHHADVERKIRNKIESICSNMSAEILSQVLFCTETLSYGVNLAINDVIISGTEFYNSTRLREFRPEDLPVSAFHNMAGRAGRLGKTQNGEANVYIGIPKWSRDGLLVDPFWTIEGYYQNINPARSKIFVVDDKKVLTDASRNSFPMSDEDPSAKISAVNFSYPFVRSVLDVLRHLNFESRSNSKTEPANKVTVSAVLSFYSNTLYAINAKTYRKQKESTLFRTAVEGVLENCSENPLLLVYKEDSVPTKYFIKPRGEAIIDTGTELSTVAPLLKIIDNLNKIISNAAKTFPPEIYVLCLLAQREINRQYIHYIPECRGGDSERKWTQEIVNKNRDIVFSSFILSLSRIGVDNPDDLGTLLRSALELWEPTQRIKGAYPEGPTDSVLRMFNGIIAWINGDERCDVEALLEGREKGHELEPKYQGKMQGFRQFTEQLHYKAIFLAKMLSTEELSSGTVSVSSERNLHELSKRLKLGCTAEAIPLFWPKSSDFRRREAVLLLSKGVTPKKILSVGKPHDLVRDILDIPPYQLDKLQHDLEKYAVKEFEELAEEMTAIPAYDFKRELLHLLWHEIERLMPDSISVFKESKGTHLGFDALIRQTLSFSSQGSNDIGEAIMGSKGRSAVDEKFRVRVSIPSKEYGCIWHGEKLVSSSLDNEASFTTNITKRYKEEFALKVIGVQFRRNWNATINNSEWQKFSDILNMFIDSKSLLIVVFPWLPTCDEMPCEVLQLLESRKRCGNSTSFISPAAYSSIVSSIVRDYISGESFMQMCSRYCESFNTVDINAIQELTENAIIALPASIREKLIQHFEVGF